MHRRSPLSIAIALALAALPFVASALASPSASAAPQARVLSPGRFSTRAERRRFRWSRKKQDPHVSVSGVNRQLVELAKAHPQLVTLTRIAQIGRDPVYRVDIKGSATAKRMLVTAGVHGNEPTGVLTAMDLIDRALRDPSLRQRAQLTVIPMVNPSGLRAKTRYSADQLDINRTFRNGKWRTESLAVARSVAGERYELAIDLHGAAKHGFFLIRNHDDKGMSSRILSAMTTALLMGGRRITARVGNYTLDAPGAATSSNPGTLKGYLGSLGARYAYTLEYSRKLAPELQRRGLLRLLRSAIDNVAAHGLSADAN